MIRQINEENGKIDAWVNANKLSLNIDKTNFIMFIIKKYTSMWKCGFWVVFKKFLSRTVMLLCAGTTPTP